MKVLIIDDEKNICLTIKEILEDENYQSDYAITFQDGFSKLKSDLYDIVFLDVWLPDKDGIMGIKEIKSYFPEVEIIMISGHGNIENAVESIKYGAYDFIEKPLSLERIILAVKHLEVKLNLQHDLMEYRLNVLKKYELIGVSKKIADLNKKIEKIAPTNAWIFITGENGTGKEHVARLIHLLSKRLTNKFVEINCSAIPTDLMESEMFGYDKGAFTGATNRKIGKFELANEGTLFLDEIGDMDLSLQAKLLRILETGEFSRVGGNDIISSDFRLISATNKDIHKEIDNNNFREDLYYRINVVPVHVAPLRERRDDIPYLVDHFVKEACYINGINLKKIDKLLLDVFINYDWPGNVRQLKNIIERMIVLSDNDIVGIETAPSFLFGKIEVNDYNNTGSIPLKKAKENYEKMYILQVLKDAGWNVSRAAKILDIERTYLHRKIRYYNLDIYK